MKKSTKGFLLGAGVGAAVCAAGAMAFKTLMDEAFSRKEPAVFKSHKGALMGKSNVDALCNASDPALVKKLLSAPTEEVIIEAADGEKLVGHLYPAENPKRVLIAFHGWRSDWAHDFAASADFWHGNGCTVLYAEMRGQGKSGGKQMSFGLLERFDVIKWAQWANERFGESVPTYLCGISMGATAVLMASGDNLPENIKGIMSDSAFVSPEQVFKHISEDNLHIPYAFFSKISDAACRRRIGLGAGAYSTLYALERCSVPVLFVHGTADTFVPVEMTMQNYNTCASPKKLLIVPGAEHCLGYITDKEEYEKTVLGFWHEYDGGCK